MSKLSVPLSKLLLLGTFLLAFWLRVRGLFAHGLQADEALFASWARLIAVWRDPLLVTQLVDKPPLAFYAQALFYPLFGEVIWAARLPNFIASLLLVVLTAVFTHQLTRSQNATLLAALLVACSPLAIWFSSTAYTDPLLLTLLLAALCAALAQRNAATGLLFALALATKYQAILFLPLVLFFLFFQQKEHGLTSPGWSHTDFLSLRSLCIPWLNFLFGLAVPICAVFLWEHARTDSFLLWNRQINNFGGLRLAWSWELWPRLLAWGENGRFLLAGWWSILLILGGFVILGFWQNGLTRQSVMVDHWQLSLLSLFTLAYTAFHWLLAIPAWPRYTLPLVPLASVLVAFTFSLLGNYLKNHRRARGERRGKEKIPPLLNLANALLGLFLIIQLIGGWQASNGRFPIGNHPFAATGIKPAFAAALLDQPYGTVLYDHFYSWQWRYYYFDKTIFVNWFPHPAALAEDLAVFGNNGSPRFLALPQNPAALPIIRAVQTADFTLAPLHSDGNVTLYELQPVP